MSQELMQKRIEEAERFIKSKATGVSSTRWRQYYHFMGEEGWINDPNGIIEIDGLYHFFYQTNPYGTKWSEIYWGHAISKDMLHWEYLPIALAPSEQYDMHPEGGCFSGSAIIKDNKLFLMYTGTSNSGRGFDQEQCIAFSEDNVHFKKIVDNPVIKKPKSIKQAFFRDPCVWKHDDLYYVVIGAQCDGKAQALLYSSSDLAEWSFVNVLAESRGEWGYMWECPGFLQIGDKYVLIFSPMGANERHVVYLVGDFSYSTGKFTYSISGEIDWGFDYYAPYTFLDQHGRRLVVAWANAWDWMPWWKDFGATGKDGWCGSFNLIKEMVLNQDNTLSFVPIEEYSKLRNDRKEETNVRIANDYLIPMGDGIHFELCFEVNLDETDADAFELYLRSDGEKATIVNIDLRQQNISVDRNNADEYSEGCTHSSLLLKNDRRLVFRIFSDSCSLEIMTDNYQTSHSVNIFPTQAQDKNYISVQNGTVVLNSITTWRMEKAMDLKPTN